VEVGCRKCGKAFDVFEKFEKIWTPADRPMVSCRFDDEEHSECEDASRDSGGDPEDGDLS
jgi:hypothetical protein